MPALMAKPTPDVAAPIPAGLPRGAWLALAAALLGWMFDGAEMAVFSMVGRPALMDLLGTTDDQLIGRWFGIIMAVNLVGAATGGVLFGWLGDRIGRVRAMTLSVFTYAVFTGLCGFAGAAWQVGLLRFIAALGMGGEWSLGVALVMEVWPNRSRAFMAGLIGAAANVGILLVGLIGLVLVVLLEQLRGGLTSAGLPQEWIELLLRNKGWRLMMILGTLPALLTVLIRMFVPESEKWQHARDEGSTGDMAGSDLLGVLVGGAGPALILFLWAWPVGAGPVPWMSLRLIGTAMGLAVAAAGYSYPMLRTMHRRGDAGPGQQPVRVTVRHMFVGACLSTVAILGSWGTTTWAVPWADQLTQSAGQAKEITQITLASGAIVGTIAGALIGGWLGRRRAFFSFCVASVLSVGWLFLGNTEYGPGFLVSVFVAGVCSTTFYGWLPLYLPELFQTSVRASGQGFAFNFGRMLAAVAILQAGGIMALFRGSHLGVAGVMLPEGYPAACLTMSLVYVFGMFVIWLAPETQGKPLPE